MHNNTPHNDAMAGLPPLTSAMPITPAPPAPYRLSMVIPVYGSERVLPELVARLQEALDRIDGMRARYEVIFICDCSPDHAWHTIQALSVQYPWVRGISLRMNAGQHNALMAGFAEARGEIIMTMDDDLQHSPSDIASLLDELARGRDVVYARFKKRKHATWKILGSRLNDMVAGYLMQKPKGLYLSPFRAMKAAICHDILRYRGPYVYVDGLILSVTRNIGTVDVDHHDRFAGDSGYSFKKSVSLWLKMATSFSIVPLRLTSFAGLFIAGLGFFLAILLIIQKFTLDRMPIGWSSLIVTILMIGGVQLVALGMLGEYLGRVLLTLNSRPQYVIGETVGIEPDATPALTTPHQPSEPRQ
jgi:undecaprenyl-phosphate 4-deoxy-4-formamido-L-arabinose transferase